MIYPENILICIVVPLLVVLAYLRRETRQFVMSYVAGMVICLLSAYISGFVGLVAHASANDTSIYFSPVIEETMKLLPTLFLIYLFDPGDEEILANAVSLGVGFATFENCCFLLAIGSESLSFSLVRGFAAGIMHVASMIILSLGLILARNNRVPSYIGVVGALSFSCDLHALYNLLVSEPGITSYVGYLLPVVMAMLFRIPYRRMLERHSSGSSDEEHEA